MKKDYYAYKRISFLLLFTFLLGINLCHAQIPRQLITTIPETLEDDDQPVTIIYDASQGNKAFNMYDGDMYAHTGVTTGGVAWQHIPDYKNCPMTKMGDNKWRITMPQGIRKFYGVPDNESISQIAIIFRNEAGDMWGKGEIGDGNIFINVGTKITVSPAKPTIHEPVVITFNANFSNPGEGKSSLHGYTGDVYAHTGLRTSKGDWQNGTKWDINSSKYKMESLGHDKWRLVIPNGIYDYYSEEEAIEGDIQEMLFVFRASDGSRQSEDIRVAVLPDLVLPSSDFPTDTESFSLIFDTSVGNEGLKDAEGPLYVHTGVTINGVDWRYATDWGTPIDKHQLTSFGSNKWKLDMPAGIRAFYGVPEGETIQGISFVLRNADGSKECKNADNSDIHLDVYRPELAIRFDAPKRAITLKQNEEFRYKITASAQAQISLNNGVEELKKESDTQVLSGSYSFATSGTYTLIAEAKSGIETVQDILTVNVQASTQEVAMPAGLQPGINYNSTDPTTVTLVLQAPYKQNVYVIGDFNDWTYSPEYQMKRDGEIFWITLTGLTAGEEYAYQYVVDGSIYIADPYTDKVLDPWNDSYITTDVYPDLKLYPSGASGIVSVFQTGQTDYQWKTLDFKRPDTQDLIVYELHLRDFTTEGTYKAALAKLPYLKDLGINAIELMPVNEFEGNDSWGYNPSFYFAVDKAYGTKDDLKAFIDECHADGIAVIIDMVLNHSFGQSPLLQLYQDEKGIPLSISPWYNVKSNIENSGLQWGADFNHESSYTRSFVDRVNTYWLTEYKVDGIRYDFTKGFSNTTYYEKDDLYANAYDAGRIYNLTRMKQVIDQVSPGAYVICEHLTNQPEEKELGNNGLMLWRNMNPQYKQAAMGYSSESDFNRLYDWNVSDMPTNSLVGYMESHDEERLGYEALTYGTDVIKGEASAPTRMKQLATCTAFFLTVPGPKMIWQFGELGYDISINEGGRTGKKPIKWEFYENADRKFLYDIYSKLLYLRKQYPELFRARGDFSNQYGFKWNVDVSSWDGGRMIHSQALDKSMVIVGNFSGLDADCYAEFTNTGIWYDYMNGGTIEVNATNQNVRVPAHEFRLYLNFNPGYRVVHSSDVSSELSKEETLKLRSGGWNTDAVQALNATLKGGQTENVVLEEADLTEVTFDGDVTSMFDGCSSLTALHMPHLNYTGNPLEGANPNCLMYVPADVTTTRSLSRANVISGNVAIGDISIDDAHPFKIAKPFTVSGHTVSYTRTFAGATKEKGWETISLPFTPTTISESYVSSDLLPVTDTQSGDFWLKKYSGSVEPGIVSFENVAKLEANNPYLIAFPGKEWGADYPDQWEVTFTAANADFDVAKAGKVTADNYHFQSSFERKTDAETPMLYMLDTDQNLFTKVAGQSSKAFRSYFVDAPSATGNTRSLSIGGGSGEITGINEVETDNDHFWTARGGKGEVIIQVMQSSEIAVYDMTGQQIYRQILPEGVVNLTLPQGIYIVNKKKVVVY